MPKKRIHITKERLYHLYWELGMTVPEISKRLGCSEASIYRIMGEYSIPRRSRSEAHRHIHVTHKHLNHLYWELEWPIRKIAEHLGCGATTVRSLMEGYGIPRRGKSVAQERFDVPKGLLHHLYWELGWSTYHIADHLGCDSSTVRSIMDRYGIPRRNPSEAATRYPKADFSGDWLLMAYLIGFRLGDLTVTMVTDGSTSRTIKVQCNSTKSEQIALIRSLFEPYGHVTIGRQSDGSTHIACYLNMTFDFLLPKEDRIPNWVVQNPRYFFPFLAGYIDAEGCISIHSGKARLRIASYDVQILHQIHQMLQRLGIPGPPPRISQRKGYTSPAHPNPMRQDYWLVGRYAKNSLLRLFELLDPYLRHAKRRRDMEKAKANIQERNRKIHQRRA